MHISMQNYTEFYYLYVTNRPKIAGQNSGNYTGLIAGTSLQSRVAYGSNLQYGTGK